MSPFRRTRKYAAGPAKARMTRSRRVEGVEPMLAKRARRKNRNFLINPLMMKWPSKDHKPISRSLELWGKRRRNGWCDYGGMKDDNSPGEAHVTFAISQFAMRSGNMVTCSHPAAPMS